MIFPHHFDLQEQPFRHARRRHDPRLVALLAARLHHRVERHDVEAAEQAEQEFGMECTYEEGDVEDEVCFKRSGVTGTLKVNKASFELDAQLGFLLGAFKGSIETEIVKRLDDLLADKGRARSGRKS